MDEQTLIELLRAGLDGMRMHGQALLDLAQLIEDKVNELVETPAFPKPEPPEDIINDLPWNKNARWPFPTYGKDVSLASKEYITFHHSAGVRDTTNIEYWNRLHTVTKGWSHIGYHFAIGALKSGGEIGLYQCNRAGEFSWHDSRNVDTIGVCIAGDLRAGRDDAPTPEQIDLAGRLLAWLVPQLPNNFKGVTFHKLIQATACPGDVERWGDEIVEAAQKYGLDLTGKWGVRPVTTRVSSYALVKSPPESDYEDV